MSKFANIGVHVDVSKISQELGDAVDNDQVRKATHEELDRISQPYIPWDQGVLAQSGQATAEALTYPGPYAHYQWYGEVMAGTAPKYYTGRKLQHRTDKNPLATSHWDEAALQANMDRFLWFIKAYVEEGKR